MNLRPKQQTFGFVRHGGARRGAGRKPKGKRAGVSHAKRPALASRFPVHVTMKLAKGLPGLRRPAIYRVLCEAFDKSRERAGRLEGGVFRLVHYSVQSDHLHLVCEAKDRLSLSRGLQGLSIRVAKALNRAWQRKGRVFADRYHLRILRTPREVRNVLRYVMGNARRHGQPIDPRRPDPYSSGAWFDGWRDWVWDGFMGPEGPIAHARTWLLSKGWRRQGRIRLTEIPGAG
jgi:hypothetical protein